MTAREEMLGRIRTALDRSAASDGIPGSAGVGSAGVGGYRVRGDLDGEALLDRLVERLRDYGCSVLTCGDDSLATTVATALTARGVARIVVPAGLDALVSGAEDGAGGRGAGWPDAIGPVEFVADDGFSAEELDSFDGVLTTATVAIAETGTIVLDGSAGQGRRALSLVPDYHLCVVRERQVVGLVPEAVALLDPLRPLTWISGPSATSDIELDRVQGVHGPRTLEVILVRQG